MKFIQRLTEPSIQKLISEHEDIDPAEFVLRFSGNSDIPVKEIAEQIDCYHRAHKKFPDIHRPGMLYTRKALEQSTGEALINFKKNRYAGARALDLTGGLGMDSYAFSQSFGHVDYVEMNENTSQLARHNHQTLRVDNIRYHQTDAESFLKRSSDNWDLIYIDPSRRDEHRRVFLLSDCSPEITGMWEALKKRTKNIVVKVSPLYDITQLSRELPGCSNILVVSVQGEVKEVLAEWRAKDQQQPNIEAAGINANGDNVFYISGDVPEKPVVTASEFTRFHEPDAAIIKAGLTLKIACIYDLKFLSTESHYLTGSQTLSDFPGKSFEVIDILDYKPKQLKKYIQNNKLHKVHIHKRNFPLQVDQLYKKFGLSMGEQAHLFFTKDAKGGLICVVCQKLGWNADDAD